MKKINIIIGIAVVLFLIIPAAAASDISRTIPSGAQQAGVDIPITLTVTINDGATYYGIDETLPPGVTVTDTGGADTTEAGHLKWVVTTGAVSTTYTYKVAGPIGTYSFNGIYQTEHTTSDQTIGGNTDLVIGTSVGEDVSRTIPSGMQAPNMDIPITLTVTIDGSTYYGIDETLPPGVTVTDTGGADTTEAGHLKWVVTTGAVSTAYTYKVQGTAGSYSFGGIYQTEGTTSDQTIGGNTDLVIGASVEEDVSRTIPSGIQAPNVDIPITLTVTIDDSTYYGIDETLPPGVTVTDTGGADTSEAGHLKWVVTTGAVSTVYTYKVQGTAGLYSFGGIYQTEHTTSDQTIGGNSYLEIGDNPCLSNFCFDLQEGWNMVSIPHTIDLSESNSAIDVFKLELGEGAWRYDTPTEQYDDGEVADPLLVIPCEGYFVYKDSSDDSVSVNFDVSPNPVPPTLPVYEGWNLIGHIDTNPTAIGIFITASGLTDSLSQLTHRSVDGTWDNYPLGYMDTVAPGYGYWAALDSDASIMFGTVYGG